MVTLAARMFAVKVALGLAGFVQRMVAELRTLRPVVLTG